MIFINFLNTIKNFLFNNNTTISDDTVDNNLANSNSIDNDINDFELEVSIDDSNLLQEVTIKDVALDVSITSPVAHRKILFKVPKTMITYPILKSRTLKTVLNNSLIKDFQLENSLDKEITSVKNPCGDNLPQIKGEYFLDNQYIVCSVSYFASLVGDDDVVYAMEEDAFTLLPFIYCGYEIVPNPTIYDFEVVLTTPDITLNPIGETDEYFIYQMDVDISISLLPLIEINPTDSPLLPELNSKLDKPDGNNKFTHGELSNLLVLEFDYVDIPSTNFKDILKYFVALEKLSLTNCSYVNLYEEMFNLANLQYLFMSGNSISYLPSQISKLSKLQFLQLDYNDLTYLPDELTNLNNLQSLFMYDNKLTYLPNNFSNLVSLESLAIYNNQLNSLPDDFYKLITLQFLQLSYNNLTSLPLQFGNLTNLRYFHASNNSLTSLPSDFSNLYKLYSLDLSDNQLGSLPSDFGSLVNLQNLILSNNNLTSLPVSFGNLSKLYSLIIFGNKLASLPNEFSNLSNLIYLDISVNQLVSLPDNFDNLVDLETLSIGSNLFTSFPNKVFSLINLKTLDLSNNNFTSIPSEIENLINLETLYLRDNKLTVLPVEISKLVNLSSIDLSNNNFANLSIFKDIIIYINATAQNIDYGNLINSPSGYLLNLEFLRDYKDVLPDITGVSDGGSKQNINGIDYIVWASNLTGSNVAFTFDNYDAFNGTVTVNLV